MKRNTCLILISSADLVARPKKFRCSIEKTPRQLVVGHGTAIALSADGPPAESMVPGQKISEMPACVNGARATQRPQHNSTQRNASSRNTGFHRMRLTQCGKPKGGDARSATVKPADYLLTTAIPRVTSAPFSVRPVIRSLVGMSARPTRFSNFKDMWSSTASNQPCHADVLLRLANEVAA